MIMQQKRLIDFLYVFTTDRTHCPKGNQCDTQEEGPLLNRCKEEEVTVDYSEMAISLATKISKSD